MFVPEIKIEDLMGNSITIEEENLITFFDEAYKAKKSFDWDAAKKLYRSWLQEFKMPTERYLELSNSYLYLLLYLEEFDIIEKMPSFNLSMEGMLNPNLTKKNAGLVTKNSLHYLTSRYLKGNYRMQGTVFILDGENLCIPMVAIKDFQMEDAKENFRKWLRTFKISNGQFWMLENVDMFSQFLISIKVAKYSKLYVDTVSKTNADFESKYEITDNAIYDKKYDKTYTN